MGLMTHGASRSELQISAQPTKDWFRDASPNLGNFEGFVWRHAVKGKKSTTCKQSSVKQRPRRAGLKLNARVLIIVNPKP